MTTSDGSVRGRVEPIVVREFPAVGKYRVRVIRSSPGPRATVVLDIREYAVGERFEGFTRRGIRIGNAEELATLKAVLKEIEDQGLLDTSAARAAKAQVK